MNNETKTVTWLFNPFIYIAGTKALWLGLAAILLAGLVGSLSNTHFDGVLDTHTGAYAPRWVFLVEGIINWLCLSTILLGLGRIISRTAFRTIDLLGTQALARWPTLFMSLLALQPAFQRFGNELLEQLKQGKFNFNTIDALIFFAVAFAMIPFLCWMVFLMYKSFSVSCNVKGLKGIGFFILGILVAELLSKVCLALLVGRFITIPT